MHIPVSTEASVLQLISPLVMCPHNPDHRAKLYSHQLSFSNSMHIFLQICGLFDRGMLPTRLGQFNPEGAGGSGSRGSHCCGTVDTEDVSHWRGKEARQPKTSEANAVSWEGKCTRLPNIYATLDQNDAEMLNPALFSRPESNPNEILTKTTSQVLCVWLFGCSPALCNRESETDSESDLSNV